MTAIARPILYSFRRCPYAMRARLALQVSRQQCVVREIILRDKPAEMLALSPKGTVPVLQLPDGRVLEESLDIALWALEQNDPQQWFAPQSGTFDEMMELIAFNDGPFKHHLDRYKYAVRYDDVSEPDHHRGEGVEFLKTLEARLGGHAHLCGDRESLADNAIFPFVRQFANTDRDWFDAQPLPHLRGWLAAHLESDAFKTVMEKWPRWMPENPEILFPL